MERIKLIRLKETDSTNRYLREQVAPDDDCLMTVVTTEFQTAGRGQGTNTWESQRGCNLLFSIRTRPKDVPANRQYVILQAAALAVRDALAKRVADGGMTIKWPNDIYWHDRKISGTLSECTISKGMVSSCIVGIGVNINQRTFVSDAPNPVSLLQITGRTEDIDAVRDDIVRGFGLLITRYVNAGDYRHVADRYRQTLYRREGEHPFRDGEGDFMAAIEDVEPDGHLLLRRTDGRLSRYAFKEVAFVVDAPDIPAVHTTSDFPTKE